MEIWDEERLNKEVYKKAGFALFSEWRAQKGSDSRLGGALISERF